MSDFGRISKEEHEEWLRLPATAAALADLRSIHRMAEEGLVQAAESAATLQEISIGAGRVNGLKSAIYHLTKERK